MIDPGAAERTLEPTEDAAWLLNADGYDALRAASIEARFAISNGFLGIRAARGMTRGEGSLHSPRAYVAGLFGTPGANPAIPELIPAADWQQVRILLPTGPLVQHPGDVSSHRMTLDMKCGVLRSEARGLGSAAVHNPKIGIHARTLRLVSLADRAIGLQLIQFEIERGEGEVTLEASTDRLELGLVAERIDRDLAVWRTNRSGKRLAMATSSTLSVEGYELRPISQHELMSSWTWTCRPGQVVCFARLVGIVRIDGPDDDPGAAARRRLSGARQLGWRGVVAAHEAAWSRRWERSDVEIEGDNAAQQALRFAIYHLNSAANPADERVSIGARALTGDDYCGHVFWDTEIYLLPFYTMTWPEAARSLLMYRHRMLGGARAKAKGLGWLGALYAWESADTGEEATPEQAIGPDRQVVQILCGKQEQHISADVAYAVWNYWQVTGDDVFLLEAGAEILLETARFWVSRAQLEPDGRRHIRGVIGPDEYHETIDDNAFTNVMARWNIRRALEVAATVRERWPERWAALATALGLDDGELGEWARAAELIVTGFDPATGLFEQFAGFEQLEKVDLAAYTGRSVPMDVVLGRDRMRRSQVVKQADVVALLGLLPGEFPGAAGLKNFQYYEPLCSHGSSLSRAMHGYVAARLGLTDRALHYFHQTAAIDLGDAHVAIDGGIHIAALGGLWMTAVLGFAGLSWTAEGLALDPRLPPAWRSLGFRLQWRGRALKIRIGRVDRRVAATLTTGEPMTLFVGGQPYMLQTGKKLYVPTKMMEGGPMNAAAN